MYLLWLRVAAILYAAASVAVFPAVLYGVDRWRKWCVHLGGMALFFHFVSAVEMLVQAHRWVPVGVREVESLLGLAVAGCSSWSGGSTTPSRLACLPCRRLSSWFLFPRWGRTATSFPRRECGSAGWLRTLRRCCWPMRRWDSACWLPILYLVQERRLKSKPRRAGEDSWWAPLDWLPPLDTLERMPHATLEFGFPCMTVGLVIGSVLAQETALGAAYFLDPKIIAAFVSWAVYVLLLLVRRSGGAARAQGGLSFRRGVCGDGGGVGGEPVQPRAQVRCPMTLALHRSEPQDGADRAAGADRHLRARICRRRRARWPRCRGLRSA